VNTCKSHPTAKRYILSVLSLFLWLLAGTALAQTTISTGSIQGTVTDPSGAVVSGAKVTIRNKGTNQTSATTTNFSGTYASGALIPGSDEVRVEASGFRTVVIPLTLQVNVTSTANARLILGESAQVVEVQANEVAVNTERYRASLPASRLRICRSTVETFSTWPNWSRAFKFRMEVLSIPPRTDFLRSRSAAVSGGPLASKLTGSISATKPWVPLAKTFPWAPSRSPRCSNLRWISPLS